MKKVESAIVGHITGSVFQPMLLKKEHHRFHPETWEGQEKEDAVLWSEAEWQDGHEAGTHDGIRDGASSGRIVSKGGVKQIRKRICSHSAWVAAGNPPLTPR